MKKYDRLAAFCLALPAVLALVSGCTLVQVNLGPRQAPLQEQTVMGTGEDKILMVDLSGLMVPGRTQPMFSPWSSREDMAARLAEELQKAREDKRIKGLLIKINSPGGAVSVADVIYHQLRAFREETGVKTLAAIQSVGASGGYYAALAAEKIVALPTSVTGSIGVINLKFNLAGLMEKYGVGAETVKSAPLKDMWSPFRPSTPEERAIMQGLIDEFYGRFRSLVRENRPGMSADQLERATNAAVFTTAQALELGLIDGAAYPDQAFEEIRKMAGLKEARLIVYLRPGAYSGSIYAETPTSQPAVDMSEWLGWAVAPQMMYLWMPGLP